MLMKKILLYLLVFAMLLSLVACNGQQPSGSEQNDPAGDSSEKSNSQQPSADTTPDSEQSDPAGESGEVKKNAKDLLSLSPDVGATAASLTYTVSLHTDTVVIKRTFDGDNFSEEIGELFYAYIDGWYYQDTPESTFRAEISREEATAYYGKEFPVMPDFASLADEDLENVPVEEDFIFYSFTVSSRASFLREDLGIDPDHHIESSKATVYFNKSYRLKSIKCEHSVAPKTGDPYTVTVTITANAFADEVTLTASDSMQKYRKLLKEDAESFIASLPHPGEGDYRFYTSTKAKRENGDLLADQELEIVQSGNNYLYYFSTTPHSPITYLRYYYSDGMVYQIYYDAADMLDCYKKVRFPMTQTAFEQALALGTPPEPGDDFTDAISTNFSDTLKGTAVYENANGDVTFSYSVNPSFLLDSYDFDGQRLENAKVAVRYEKDADKLTVSITFHAQKSANTYKTFYSIEAVFEGFTGDVALTLPDPAEFPLLTD